MDTQPFHFLLAGVYKFSDPDAIINEFLSSNRGDDVICMYTEAKGFTMQCPNSVSESKIASLVKIVKSYVHNQSREEADVFEIPKVVRRMSTEIEDTNFDRVSEARTNYHADYHVDVETQEDIGRQLIEHESIVKSWTPPEKMIGEMNRLREIGNTTKCRVEYDGSIDQIVIRGEDVDSVNQAITKLETVKRAIEERETGRWNANFYIHENELNFFLQLLSPKKVTDRQLVILAGKFPLKYFEIKMVKWDVSTQRYEHVLCTPKTLKADPNQTECRLWQHHLYRRFGDESRHPRHWVVGSTSSSTISGEGASNRIVPMDKFPSVVQWNEKAASLESDPFKPLVENADNQPGVLMGDFANAPIKQSKTKGYIKTRRVVKGVQHFDANGPSEGPRGSIVSFPLIETSTAQTPNTSHAGQIKANTAAQTSKLTHTLLKVVPPPISEPYLPKETTTPSSPDVVKEIWIGNVVRGRQANDLVSVPAKKPVWAGNIVANRIVEKKQETAECETRRYQRSSNLKASSRISSRSKANTDIVSEIVESTATILAQVRSTIGQVTLAISIGRLSIDGTNVSVDLQKKSFPSSEWSTLFSSNAGQRQTPTVFSSLLTTSWIDAEYVLDLKLPHDQRIFSETPLDSSVVYEFKCRSSKTGAQVVIAFNEDGSYKMYNTPEVVGAANLFFPKRIWDARLSITELIPSATEDQETFRHVIENLYIEPERTIPRLYTKTDSSIIEIQSIVVKRQTQHACKSYPDLVLQLTECEDLVIQKSSPRQYRAFAWAAGQMVADENRLWWEASIASVKAQEIFMENTKLEVGERANWTSQTFVEGGILRDLYYLARDVVTKIDNVGCDTRALTGYASFEARTTSRRSKENSEDTKKEPFW